MNSMNRTNRIKNLIKNRVAFSLLAVFIANHAARAGTEPSGAFHDFSNGPVTTAAHPAFSSLPLTVEFRIKLDRQDQYNILIANQTKKSPWHWELFTAPKTGLLQAYLPGFKTALVNSGVCITDGQWHSVAMILEATRVQLYVDGQLKREQPVTAPAVPAPGQDLKLGALVEGGMDCKGQIDEVRISKCVRTIGNTPAEPVFTFDNETVYLWRFEESDQR